jgi:ubiquitin-like protein Nedd8
MTKTVTLHTFGDKPILFRYTPGTKTIDDITNAITNNIGYICKGNEKFSYRVNNKDIFDPFAQELLDNIEQIHMIPYRAPRKHISIEGQQIVITVKTLTTREYQIPTTTTTTIEQFKEKIEETTGFDINSQNLIFNGKRLENERTLETYSITDNASMHITLSLRGGMYAEMSGRNGKYKPLSELTIYDLDSDTLITQV